MYRPNYLDMNFITESLCYLLLCCVVWSCNSSATNLSERPDIEPVIIGTKQFIWEDPNRLDDYYGGSRIINARIWYPSSDFQSEQAKGERTSYLLFEDKLLNMLENWTLDDHERAKQIRLNSFNDLPFKSNTDESPLLIFSPSLGGNLSHYTYYAEYFAKKGYIVMGLNHLYESEVVINQSAKIILANLKFQDSLKSLQIPEEISAEDYREALGVRQKIISEDILFALNQIFETQPFVGKIDKNKIAVFGHSLGGAAALYASLLDHRIKAVINLDGTPPSEVLEKGIRVPFLFIEDLTDYKNHPGYAKLHKRRSDLCRKNRADAWRILIKEFDHNSFLDINYYFSKNAEIQKQEKQNLDIVIAYMDYFLDTNFIDTVDEESKMPETNRVEIIRFIK